MKYRHKPVDVDVFIFDEAADMCCPEWFQKAQATGQAIINWRLVDGAAKIYGCTLYDARGKREADAKCGDYIVREHTGELRRMTKKNFEQMYEKAR